MKTSWARSTWISSWLLVATALAPAVHAGDGAWTRVGPFGGLEFVLEVDPLDANTVFATYRSGGVYRSTDGGASWRSSAAGLPAVSLHGLAASPHAAGTVLAAGRDRQVYRSTDGGLTWALSSTGLSPLAAFAIPVATFAHHPTDDQVVFLAWTGSGTTGAFKSTDAGLSWADASAGLAGATLSDLAIDPVTPTRLYARGGFGKGVFRSTDGGASWSAANSGLPFISSGPTLRSLALDPTDPTRLYASSTFENDLYRTTNGGDSWHLVNDDALSLVALRVQPTTGDVYGGHDQNASRRRRLQRSTDQGATWTEVSTGADHLRRLAFVPGETSTLFAGALDGVYRTTDTGATWSPAFDGIHGHLVGGVAISPSDPDVWYLASDRVGLFRSTDDGASFAFRNGGLSSQLAEAVAVDPTDADRVFTDGGTLGSLLYTFPATDSLMVTSTNGGATWTPIPTAATPDGTGTSSTFFQTWDYAFAPGDPTTLFVAVPGTNDPGATFPGFAGMLRSTDGGATYQHRSAGLPTSVSPNDLAISPVAASTLYYAAGTLHKTTDAGGSWTDLSAALGAVGARSVAPHPTATSTVVVSASGGLRRSTDGGATWAPFGSLPAGTVDTVASHPTDPMTLFATLTNDAPYWSRDGGATWQPLRGGINDRTFVSLHLDPADPHHLVVGTVAGAFEIALDPAHVFADNFETGDLSAWASSVP